MAEERKFYLHSSKRLKRDIEFDNLTYTVKNNKGNKNILNGLSGMFKSGELTAIMGPSGAGKSSLLNILSGFHKQGTSGMIRCTGQEVKDVEKVSYTKDSCYILQDDALCPLFTVWETMVFAAKLKLGTMEAESRHWLLSNILETLGLAETVHTRCSRLSGGQRKRLSIALELIDNPPIMFLDEPTTGLDSLSSFQCVSVLKDLAHDGRTIICTIHQPSASIFEMFDHVYVIADGHCLYQGTALNTIPFLASVGLDCPQYHNPADHLLEVANREFGDFNDKLIKVTRENNWRSKPQTNKLHLIEEPSQTHLFTSEENKMAQKPSEFYRFRILLLRNVIQLYRDWPLLHLKCILHILVGIFIGLLYYDYGNDGSKTMKNIGYFLVSIVYLSYTTMMPAALKLPSEVPIVRKESFNNWFKLNTYYMSYVLVHMPLETIFTVMYTVSSYFLTGQVMEFMRMIKVLTIMILSSLTAESMGVILGTSVNPINGTFLGAICMALFLVVAGFLMIFAHMSTVMYSLSYLSFMAYGLEASVEATYADRASLPCPDDVAYCHLKSPSFLLAELGMDKGNYYNDLLCLAGHVLSRFFAKLLIHFAVGIFIGLFFQGIGADASLLIYNIGFLGFSVTYMSYTSMMPSVLSLPREIPLIKRENFNNYYCLPTYYTMYIVCSIPQQIIFAFIFTSVTYVMSGQLMEGARYAIYFYGAVMINMISDVLGQIIGSILKAANGTFIAGVLSAYFVLCSGYLIVTRQSQLASILVVTSFHRYGLNALIMATLGWNRVKLPCAASYCHYNINSLLEEYSFNTHPLYIDVSYLSTTYIIACFIGYYTLQFKLKFI